MRTQKQKIKGKKEAQKVVSDEGFWNYWGVQGAEFINYWTVLYCTVRGYVTAAEKI
jgi:hypothetical protein